jgi:hypothetical protein
MATLRNQIAELAIEAALGLHCEDARIDLISPQNGGRFLVSMHGTIRGQAQDIQALVEADERSELACSRIWIAGQNE